MRGVKGVKERPNCQTNNVKHIANRQFHSSARGFHTPKSKNKVFSSSTRLAKGINH